MQEVKRVVKVNNILLVVCSTSNVQTNAVDTYLNHPIKEMCDNDILISINTDNSTVSNASITEEYKKLYD